MRASCRLVGLLVAAFSCGCGSSGAPVEKAVPVSGLLTFQGQPLGGYRVTLVPEDGRRAASGVTDEAGKFVLSTNQAGDGAPPGRCKVSVAWEGPPQQDAGGLDQPVEDPRLLPKQPVPLPAKFANPEESGVVVEIPSSGIEDLKIELQ